MIVKVDKTVKINEPQKVAQLLRDILEVESDIDKDKEHFWVIGLDTQNMVLFVDLCSLGTLNATLVHPREVFRLAVSKGTDRIIVGHNHPTNSANISPSSEDLKVTERLAKAGEILGISLLDHIIIGKSEYFSFSENRKILGINWL